MIADFQTHAANERTFLAWVRTAIAVVGFGLGAARLDGPSQVWSEVALLGSGGIVILLAFVRLRRLRAAIMSRAEMEARYVPADGILILLVAALFVMLALFGLHVS